MPAIGYHCQAKVISRSAGKSAVAAAAYRTGLKLEDERYGKIRDYSRKDGVELVYHSAPKDAPAWARDIGEAWNAVEAVENRKNSTVAREYEAAFPHQVSAEQREWMVKDFVREELTRKGLMVTAAIHAPSQEGDERNYHVHVLFSDRPLDENGWNKNKDRSFASFASRTVILDHAREKWAELGARQLVRAGYPVEAERWRVGHKTTPEQWAAAIERGDLDYAATLHDREPTKHLGVMATQIERDGRASYRGEENREIEDRNEQRQQVAQELQAIAAELNRLEQQPHHEPAQTVAREIVQAREETSRSMGEQMAPDTREELAEPQAIVLPELDHNQPLAASVERVADKVENIVVPVLGAGLKAVEKAVSGLEAFLFGSGGAPPRQHSPSLPPPINQSAARSRTAKEQLNRQDSNAQDAQTESVKEMFPIHVNAEMQEAARRQREAEQRAREEHNRDR